MLARCLGILVGVIRLIMDRIDRYTFMDSGIYCRGALSIAGSVDSPRLDADIWG